MITRINIDNPIYIYTWKKKNCKKKKGKIVHIFFEIILFEKCPENLKKESAHFLNISEQGGGNERSRGEEIEGWSGNDGCQRDGASLRRRWVPDRVVIKPIESQGLFISRSEGHVQRWWVTWNSRQILFYYIFKFLTSLNFDAREKKKKK